MIGARNLSRSPKIFGVGVEFRQLRKDVEQARRGLRGGRLQLVGRVPGHGPSFFGRDHRDLLSRLLRLRRRRQLRRVQPRRRRQNQVRPSGPYYKHGKIGGGGIIAQK